MAGLAGALEVVPAQPTFAPLPNWYPVIHFVRDFPGAMRPDLTDGIGSQLR
jgi:hypothetical protein